MLNFPIKVRVTAPCGAVGRDNAIRKINFGIGTYTSSGVTHKIDTYICGITHPVSKFDGRIIAVLTRKDGTKAAVAAGKNQRYARADIAVFLDGSEDSNGYTLDCLYERSCGAVVFNKKDGLIRFLLIKNKRSSRWGFPKGHMEKGEDEETTAKREVREETGLKIRIIPGFEKHSSYRIGGRIEKSVVLFLASSNDDRTVIQPEEIEDCIWLDYEQAYVNLNYENDRMILKNANRFIIEHPEVLTDD